MLNFRGVKQVKPLNVRGEMLREQLNVRSKDNYRGDRI